MSEMAARVEREIGGLDMLVHSVAAGPEGACIEGVRNHLLDVVQRPLLETSSTGYLAASCASSFSLVLLAIARKIH